MHDLFLGIGKILGSNIVTRGITRLFFGYSNKVLRQEILGIEFKNPVGLAAGFDKDAEMINITNSVGFGFTEVGSITGQKCSGNPKPRLWRLKKSQAIVVYYGLKNKGASGISKKLKGMKLPLPVGISIAKTNCKDTVSLKKGIKDYVKAYKAFSNIGDYYTINISCPNAFGGEPFTAPEKLEQLLTAISRIKRPFRSHKTKPIFLKIAPDLDQKTLDLLIKTAEKFHIDGFICANLAKDRSQVKIKERDLPENGSISGKPAQPLSDKTIKYIYKKTKGRMIIIGCGGIFSAKDAYKKIKLGASLVQLFTGMIYQGPQLISEINRGLVKLLKDDGYKNISEAIGVNNK